VISSYYSGVLSSNIFLIYIITQLLIYTLLLDLLTPYSINYYVLYIQKQGSWEYETDLILEGLLIVEFILFLCLFIWSLECTILIDLSNRF
jgi:hypothetical protein